LWEGRVELGAQRIDEHLERAGTDGMIRTPDGFREVLAGDALTGVADEGLKQAELETGEVDAVAGARDGVTHGVDDDIGGLDGAVALLT